jgi:hypothetical protein
MAPKKKPAACGNTGRASEGFSSATNCSEATIPALNFQLSFLSRRLGALDPSVLAAIAALAFPQVLQ